MRLRAVFLILVAAAALGTAAVGGFFMLSDPERVRRAAEASLSSTLGLDVRLTGPIGLHFLPRPEAVILTPKVVAATDGRHLASADRIDLALSPLALLAGQEPVSSLTVVRPDLTVPLALTDLFRLAKGGGPGSFDILDGALDLEVVPGAPPLVLTGISLERSQDEAGETRIALTAQAGTGPPTTEPLSFQARLRRPDGSGAVPAELELRLGAAPSVLAGSWQGLLAEDRLFGRILLEAARPLPAWLGEDMARLSLPSSWQAEASLDLSPAGLKLTGFTAKAGPASLAGSLELDAASREGSLRLELRDLALEALPLVAVNRLQGKLAGYRLAGRVIGRDLNLRGVPVPSLEVTGGIEGDGGLVIERGVASIAADGAFRLDQGRLRPGERPTLTGDIILDLPSARPVLDRLGVLPAGLAADKPGALLVEGGLRWMPDAWELTRAAVRSDQSGFHGKIGLAAGQVTLQGAIDRLDLTEWFAQPGSWGQILARLPDGVADLRIGRLSKGRAWIGDVAIEASRRKGRLVIAEASAGSGDDLHLTLAGSVEADASSVDLVVGLDASRPARITSILDLDLPWLARLEALHGTASLRGPADRLEVMLEAQSGARGLTLAGTFGRGQHAPATALRLHGQAPDLAALLRDLALLPVEPQALSGKVTTQADLSRAKDGRWLARIDLQAGPLQAEGQLDLRITDGPPRLAGQIALSALSPASIQGLYDFLSTSLAFAPGSPLRWPGNWPASSLYWGWLFSTELDLTLRRQGLAEGGGLGRIRLEAGRLELERLDLGLPEGGRLQGEIHVDGTGEVPKIAMALTLDELDAAWVGARLGIARAPTARLAAEIELAGKGASVAAIVADLAGQVRLAMGPGTVPPATGSATPPFAFSSLQGQFAAARGILRSSPPHLVLDLPDRSRRYLEVLLDLPVWFLDARLLPEADLPGQHLVGPPGRIQTIGIPPTDPAKLSPTDPASAPDGPGGRTLPRSAGPAPAPIP